MNRMRTSARFVRLGAVSVLLLAHSAFAVDRHVPSQYPTIRAALNAAVNGDRVIIADGTYTGPDNRDLSDGNKRIVIRSASRDATQCIIDCEGLARGFTLLHDDSELRELTIRNGRAEMFGYGGGVVVSGGATIEECRFVNCRGDMGGGMYVNNPDGPLPTINNCHFSGNSAPFGGAGLFVNQSGGVYANCFFYDNFASGDVGGAVRAVGGSVQNAVFRNCLFMLNGAPNGGGAMSLGLNCEALDCIAWSNGSTPFDLNMNATVTSSIIQGLPETPDQAGNFGSNPHFVDPVGGNYRLAVTSPAINRGSETGYGETDLDGNARTRGGRVDLGPYEYQGDGPVPTDTCANAFTIGEGTHTGSTAGAPINPGDLCVYEPTGGTVWFRWIATCSAPLRVKTCGSAFDTVISIYSGDCENRTLIDCNDDAFNPCPTNAYASELVVPVTSGTTYLIRLGGYQDAEGPFMLSVDLEEPLPTSCEFPIVIAGLDTPFNTSCENLEALQSCITGPQSPTAWFSYTPAANGVLNLSTCGSSFDTVLGIWTGSCNQRILRECNDNTPCESGELSSFISTAVQSGETYMIRVAGVQGASGSGVLRAELTHPVGPLTNASFEQGAAGTIPIGSTAISNWIVTRGGVDVTTVWQTVDGSRSVDLQGRDSSGGIQQTVTTVPGVRYRLTFALAGNPDNGPVIKNMAARAGSIIENFSFDTTGRTRTNMGWVDHSIVFTATGEATELEFYSTDAPGNWGAVIDHIRLAEDADVPCPADFNNDGVANSQDFFEFVQRFFVLDPTADFNTDGAVNSQDFFDFVTTFFAGC